MSAETELKGQIDRMALIRELRQLIPATGTSFRARVDAAADFGYEDDILGASITAMDEALEDDGVWSTPALKKWFDLHNTHFAVRLGLLSSTFDSYLALKGWTVPLWFSECHREAMGQPISPQYVFPQGVRPADTVDPTGSNMHQLGMWTGASTYTSVDGALPLTVKGAAVLIVSREATPGGTSPILTATLQDGTTKDIAFTPSATLFGQVILGQQAVGAAGAAAGQMVIPVAATAQFKAGEWVTIVNAARTVVEVAQIDVVTTNTSITLLTNLVNAFVLNDLVLPRFVNTARTSGSITSGKHLDIYSMPDRVIAL